MKQYMETTKPKKEYVTPTCEVVMLDSQANLLTPSRMDVIPCGGSYPPCTD